jgi:hypothetical protein
VCSFLGRHVNVGGLIPDAGWTQLACLLQCTTYVHIDVVPLLVCPIAELAFRYRHDKTQQFTDDIQLPNFECISWRLHTYLRILKYLIGCKRELAGWLKWAVDCHIPLVCAIQAGHIKCIVDVYRLGLDPRQQTKFPKHPDNMVNFDVMSVWQQADVKLYSVEWLLGLVCPVKRSSRQLIKIISLMILENNQSDAARFFEDAFKQFALGNCQNANGSTNFAYRQLVYSWDITHILGICTKYIKTHLIDFVLYEIILIAIRSNAVADDYIGYCVDLPKLYTLTNTICDLHLRPCLSHNIPPQRVTKGLILQHTTIRTKQTRRYTSVINYLYIRANVNKRSSRVALIDTPMPQRDIVMQLAVEHNKIIGPKEQLTPKTIAWFRSFFDNSIHYALQRTTLVSLPARVARMQYSAVATRLGGKRKLACVAFCYHCAALRVNPVGYTPKKKTDFMRLFGANNSMVCDACDNEVVYIDLIGKVLTSRISHHDPGEFIRTTLCTTCASLCIMDATCTSYNKGTITCEICTNKRVIVRPICYKKCPVDKSREPDYEFYARDENGLITSYAHCHRHPVVSKRITVPSLSCLL